jgi:ethanolamine utilization protein EutA (predicted chaperonin)
MSVESRTIANLKGQLSKFSGIISKGFKKPKKKLIKEMIYGIQAAKDVKLSNIARTLKEDQSLIKTEDRLSRNLDDVDFTKGINDEIMRLAASKITDDMVIAIDPGDIRKKYAKKMEFLEKVYDGSEKEIGNGYPLCKAVASDIESKKVIPLYCEAYSHSAYDVKSENEQILKMIDVIFSHIKDKGIHAIDRG